MSPVYKKMKEIMSPELISPDTSIGDWTFVGKGTAITKATIGRYCSIATNCSIGMGEHLIDTISTSVHFYPPGRARDILVQKDLVIGHDVWIAADSIVRRGVRIGNGAIVGANSFVNKDVDDFAIVAGNPARFIRYRFSEQKRNAIKASRWWEFEKDEAYKIIQELEKLQ
jgi:virginiamycin A acetyltransferase